MKCNKCGRDYSFKVWQIHRERCSGIQEKEKEQAKAEEVDEFERQNLIEFAGKHDIKIDRRWTTQRIRAVVEESF